MKLQNLYETNDGTFVGVHLTSDTTARLCGWMDQNLIKNPQTADKIHTTLVLDKETQFLHDPLTYEPSIPIDPDTYNIELFGPENDILVLSFDSPFLQKRHLQLREKYGLAWDWPDYTPHITLTYDAQEIKTELETPDFAIELSGEYVTAFNSDWEK